MSKAPTTTKEVFNLFAKGQKKPDSIEPAVTIDSIIDLILSETIDEEEATPFHYLARYGNTALIEQIFDNPKIARWSNFGTYFHRQDKGGGSVLNEACSWTELGVVKLFFNRGLTFNQQELNSALKDTIEGYIIYRSEKNKNTEIEISNIYKTNEIIWILFSQGTEISISEEREKNFPKFYFSKFREAVSIADIALTDPNYIISPKYGHIKDFIVKRVENLKKLEPAAHLPAPTVTIDSKEPRADTKAPIALPNIENNLRPKDTIPVARSHQRPDDSTATSFPNIDKPWTKKVKQRPSSTPIRATEYLRKNDAESSSSPKLPMVDNKHASSLLPKLNSRGSAPKDPSVFPSLSK